MSITTKVKVDTSAFKKLKAQMEALKVDVGYINSPNHWLSSKRGKEFSVAALASHLHYYSDWDDTFMLSDTKKSEVSRTVNTVLNTTFGNIPPTAVATLIGVALGKDIAVNIQNVSYPPNEDRWASIKTFNDPLVYGSAIGSTPKLISEITHKVRV